MRFELALSDPGYPEHLRQSPDAPERLYGIGDPGVLMAGLAVVGARKATPYGVRAAGEFARYAVEYGCVVISGAAVGCDQAAHEATLSADGTTIAVLAGGADVVYPQNARSLLRMIAEKGAVISEHPWGTRPQRWMFRTRNRIIAGLSAALLVVEARVPSGTFSTVDYALAAQRDVLAVPGSIYAPECEGPNRLISQGATPVVDERDLHLALDASFGGSSFEIPQARVAPEEVDPLVRALRAGPFRLDEVAESLGVDVVALSRRAGSLEAAGVIQRYPDGRYGAYSR